MSRRLKSRKMHLNAEINVVSLIDVILLLLIIFMITAPMMAGGIDLTLPQADVQPIESKDAIVVDIDRYGKIRVDGKQWSMAELQGGFKAYAKGRDDVTFRADSTVAYGPIFRIMTILNASGVKSFGMAGEQENIRQ